jgi:O-antigen ligase
MIVLWIFFTDLHKNFDLIKKEPFFYALAVFIIVLLVGLLWTETENLKLGIKYIARYWYLLPIPIIYTSIKKRFILPAISAFLLGMFISEIVSYSIFFELIQFPGVSSKDPSPFMQHTLYSTFLVFTGGILLNRILETDKSWHKVLYAFFFLTVTTNLFINSGRTGQIIFIFVAAFTLLTHYKLTVRSFLLTTGSLVLISYMFYLYSPNFKNRMTQAYTELSRMSYNSSIGSRIGLKIVAFDIILENPILGVGTGDYLDAKAYAVEQHHPDWKRVKSYVHYHDQYAEYTVMAGVFGLLGYLYILFSVYSIKLNNTRMKTIKYILLITFLLSSFTDAMFHLNKPLSLFALFTGLLLAYKRYEQTTSVSN